MLTIITQLQTAADVFVNRWAPTLPANALETLDAMCHRVIEFLVSLNADGVLSPLEVVSWFSRFETLLDHLTNAYASGFVPMLTVANGVSAWIEYVRAFTG